MVLGLVVLVALQGGFMSWYRRYHGALPSMRRAPGEFRRTFVAYGLGLLAVVGAIAGAAAQRTRERLA
jgi:hypothetical protein